MKKGWLIGAAIAAMVLMGGCATKDFMFNEALPETQTCSLELRKSVSISLFDGEPVKWKPGFFGSSSNISHVPAGHHTMVVTWYTQRQTGYGNTTQVESVPHNTEYNYDFVAGHTYRIYHSSFNFILSLDFGIKFKDVTKKAVLAQLGE